MDTREARLQMRDLGHDALSILERIAAGEPATAEDRQRLRELAASARGTLADAGYPAEAVWGGLQRAAMGIETSLGASDPLFWSDALEQLRTGLETLDALVAGWSPREQDFRIVG